MSSQMSVLTSFILQPNNRWKNTEYVDESQEFIFESLIRDELSFLTRKL